MPRPKQHTVRLNNEEQAQLKALIRKGEGNARVSTRARILLLADDNCFDEDVAEMLKVSASTVLSIRRRFVTEGLEAALYDKPRSGAVPKLDGKQEALLVALACSQPNDRESWTMQLLADKLVETVVDSISDETVRRTPKKTTSSLGKRNNGASPK